MKQPNTTWLTMFIDRSIQHNWDMSLDKRFEGLIFNLSHGPNFFHRFMQRLIFGIYWRKDVCLWPLPGNNLPPISLTVPKEIFSEYVPRYRLVLERVK